MTPIVVDPPLSTRSPLMLLAATLERADGTEVELILPGGRTIAKAELIKLKTREAVSDRPQQRGTVNRSKFRDGAIVSLTGELFGLDASECWDQWQALEQVFAECVDEDHLLRYSTPNNDLQRAVRLIDVDSPIDTDRDVLTYQVQLRSDDPNAYSQDETTVVSSALAAAAGGLTFPAAFPWRFTPSAGGVAACVNAGTVSTPPIFRIYGQATLPQLLHVETDQRIVLTGEVAAGDYLEVDVWNRTVKLNGEINRRNLVNFSATTWFELPVGVSTIRMLASTFDSAAHVEVVTRDARIA